MSTEEPMLDVYVFFDPQQTEHIAELIKSAGVEFLLRDRTSSAFPTNIGTTAETFIAVSAADYDKTRSLIEGAVEDGVIPDDGKIIDRES